MSVSLAMSRPERKQRILQAGSLMRLLDQPDGLELLVAEAQEEDSDRLIEPAQLNYMLLLREERLRRSTRPQLFGNVADVIIVPGFLGSSLTDDTGGHGLIWIDPTLAIDRNGRQLGALQLEPMRMSTQATAGGRPIPEIERDQNRAVSVRASGTVTGMYDLLAWDLEFRRYGTSYFPFDWRKDLERSAALLASRIRARQARTTRPLHLIAHSQGALVARRALQMLGPLVARSLVSNLVLLGPANFGSFSAAFAFTGQNSAIDVLTRLGVQADFKNVLQSFTGLYQLLPWKKENFSNGFDPEVFADRNNWSLGIQPDRLNYGFKWAAQIDTQFFNDRTTIILGQAKTAGAVKFNNGQVEADGPDVPGDGTVTDANARLPNVRTYRVPNANHALLATYPTVLAAVRAILRGEVPGIQRVALAARTARTLGSTKDEVIELESLETPRLQTIPLTTLASASRSIAETQSLRPQSLRPVPTSPYFRRLRVYSFDPLLATNLSGLGISTITVNLPWDGDDVQPGPVGEYLEVIDYDPMSRRFYHPIDINDIRLVAQDGLAPAESNPQFHQQMTYAVAMATIMTFEEALGRSALWAPHLPRDDDGQIITPADDSESYVARLRIYPHALREANAYYDPERNAILFGYFASSEDPGGQTLPGGVVFTCQSYDIIAHETTHALLHGLHRYYLESSNADVLAFHEAFADAVALLQKFSYAEVVKHQLAKTRGDLRQNHLLGELAQQFGAALGGHRGALRQYINVPPDPQKIHDTDQPHERGAILMAALFRAFLNIYEHRTRDLYRIASRGTGILPDGELLPDLVNRLAQEASKAARHLLTMSVRALDYVPPVDLTFGEYLRALITADFEMVRNDDLHYRTAVIDAFRSWGLYPADVNVLDQSAMLWRQPDPKDASALREAIQQLDLSEHDHDERDRRATFLRMRANCLQFRNWIYQQARQPGNHTLFGIMVLGGGVQSIARNRFNRPKFEVHSIRTCKRTGPDGQQRKDLVVEIVQRRAGYFSKVLQQQVDMADQPWAFSTQQAHELNRPLAETPDFWFRGGCTLIIEPSTGAIRYSIYKSVLSEHRLERQRHFEADVTNLGAAATYFDTQRHNPFAQLHAADSQEPIYG